MEMEPMEENKQVEQQYNVDTSRPFTSVKEAVATFGHRIMLPGKIHTLNSKPVSPIASPSISQTAKPVSPITASPRLSHTASFSSSPRNQRPSLPSSPQVSKEEFMDVLKKLEAEITETKTEVRMLKEREFDTEMALSSLNAELHKNIAKMAKAEADTAGKNKALNVKEKKENGEEKRRKKLMRKVAKEYPTLAQILDSNKNGYFVKTTKKKKKPIVPLLSDFFFFNKKGSSTEISGRPLYTTSST